MINGMKKGYDYHPLLPASSSVTEEHTESCENNNMLKQRPLIFEHCCELANYRKPPVLEPRDFI